MTTINTQLPEVLFARAKAIAEREQMSLDQFIALALAGQIASWEVGKEFEARATRGAWRRSVEILDMAPSIEPPAEDRL